MLGFLKGPDYPIEGLYGSETNPGPAELTVLTALAKACRVRPLVLLRARAYNPATAMIHYQDWCGAPSNRSASRGLTRHAGGLWIELRAVISITPFSTTIFRTFASAYTPSAASRSIRRSH